MNRYALVISQLYKPDPASVGQHIADAAEELAGRGWNVEVFTADRGYDDPRQRYPLRENRRGVDIRRIRFSSFGKRTLFHRMAGQISYCAQVLARCLVGPKADLVLITTIPVISTLVGLLLNVTRRVRIVYWVMDINPDQAVAAGKASRNSLAVHMLEFLNRRMLERATVIVALDKYMARNLEQKSLAAADRIQVLPPWPHESHLQRIEHVENPFREEHDLTDKFVVMYSGNHSLVHPLTTLLKAALVLSNRADIVFAFVGGGEAKPGVLDFVDQHCLSNIRVLPYQPLEKVRYSLSAADLHVVSMGNDMVGIVHPCKFYGAMALAKPVLCFGPSESHVGDLIRAEQCGWVINHDDVESTVALILELAATPPQQLSIIGMNGRRAVDRSLSERVLRRRFAEIVEEAVA